MIIFKQLKIWQKGIEIAVKSFDLIFTFPKEQRFALAVQISKAAISIPFNIAEGAGRQSYTDFGRFIKIAPGSSFELETQLIISQRVNYGNPTLLAEILSLLNEEQKMLVGFGKSLAAKTVQPH